MPDIAGRSYIERLDRKRLTTTSAEITRLNQQRWAFPALRTHTCICASDGWV
jgi:hypothetical protein